MKIKKLGHCCLLVDTGKVKILTDPGSFTVDAHKGITGIDIILVTHEHGDHIHVDSLKEIIKNNPDAQVITNTAVGKLIEDAGIPFKKVEGSDATEILGALIEAFDAQHEEIFEQVGQVQNTGYFVDNTFFYPGDAYCNPNKEIEVLALPVAGPWCKTPEAIRYALELKPKKAFPVHDGMIKEDKIGVAYKHPQNILGQHNIEFIPMMDGDEIEV